jgi:hypothetical protein
MIVLFKNIPNDTYHNDISSIVKPVINGGLFKKKGTLNNLEILALKEINTGLLEYQALAYIEPEEVANRVIKTLNGFQFKGCRITVRKFFLRDWKNDKRKGENDAAWQHKEKRTNPTRRRNLKAYKVSLPKYI